MKVEDQEQCTSLRIPQAALWAGISKHNPDFISYDSTAKLAYLLHPTEPIFIMQKGFISSTCTGTPVYIIHIDITHFFLFFIFVVVVVVVVAVFFLLLFFDYIYFILSSMPYYCPVQCNAVFYYPLPPPPPLPSASTLHLSCICTCTHKPCIPPPPSASTLPHLSCICTSIHT